VLHHLGRPERVRFSQISVASI